MSKLITKEETVQHYKALGRLGRIIKLPDYNWSTYLKKFVQHSRITASLGTSHDNDKWGFLVSQLDSSIGFPKHLDLYQLGLYQFGYWETTPSDKKVTR